MAPKVIYLGTAESFQAHRPEIHERFPGLAVEVLARGVPKGMVVWPSDHIVVCETFYESHVAEKQASVRQLCVDPDMEWERIC